MTKIINGKEIAADLRDKLKKEIYNTFDFESEYTF